MKKLLACMILGLASTGVLAQSATIEEVTVPPGTASAEVDVIFDDEGADVEAVGLNVSYDPSQLTFVSCEDPDGTSSGLQTCEELGGPDSGTVNIGDFGNPDGTAGSTVIAVLTFTIDNPSVEATHDLTFQNPTVTIGGGDTTPTTDPGFIRVMTPVGPSLSASPASVTLMGGGSDTITVSASDGEVTGISCAYTGDGAISVSDTVPSSLAAGESADVTASCSNAAAGSFSGTFACTSDNGGNTSTPIDCTVGANAAATFNPPNGGTLTIPVPAGGQGSGSVVFGNTGNIAYTVDSCTITGAAFSSTATFPITVNPGDSDAVVISVQDDGTSPTGSISCSLTVNGSPVTYDATLGVLVQAVNVPTLSEWAMILMALGLFGFGFWTLRRRGDFTA